MSKKNSAAIGDVAQKQQNEVNKNYQVFKRQLPDLLESHRGEVALMKNGKIVDFFDTDRDAWAAGELHYSNDVFSVQEVTDNVNCIGWIDYAVQKTPN